jgi:hypothetical protein
LLQLQRLILLRALLLLLLLLLLARQGQPQDEAPPPDPVQYGISPELERFVASLTYSTFRWVGV